jgi:hypothetical protein
VGCHSPLKVNHSLAPLEYPSRVGPIAVAQRFQRRAVKTAWAHQEKTDMQVGFISDEVSSPAFLAERDHLPDSGPRKRSSQPVLVASHNAPSARA